jgi:hypothetical protein
MPERKAGTGASCPVGGRRRHGPVLIFEQRPGISGGTKGQGWRWLFPVPLVNAQFDFDSPNGRGMPGCTWWLSERAFSGYPRRRP